MDQALLTSAADTVMTRWPTARPAAAVILGSGWSEVRELFDARDELPFDQIPGLGAPSIDGHAGKLVWGTLQGVEAFVFQGRRHFYEGQGWTPVAVPIALARSAGVRTLLLTNAAGGLNERLAPGELMLIRDHLNLMGSNPLVGPHLELFGVRFPDLTAVYDRPLSELMVTAAQKAGVLLHEGVFAAMSGPAYETPAESRYVLRLGADAVGMSTVPEAVLAHAAGIKVVALSCIANLAAGLGPGQLAHEEVKAVLEAALPKIGAVIREYFGRLREHPAIQ